AALMAAGFALTAATMAVVLGTILVGMAAALAWIPLKLAGQLATRCATTAAATCRRASGAARRSISDVNER
ncbi:MAG: hypothetical protein OXG72_08385, partial [Acidobacteria bacterium]|nr:hypothetical protein [Acidobacteriota bacterium]